jgi:hypothetical protein
MQKLNLQLVGPGTVIVLTVSGGDNTIATISVSDVDFVRGVKALMEQAKHYPGSALNTLEAVVER